MIKKYVARQVIVDRHAKPFSYELLYHNTNTLPEGTTLEVAIKDLISTLSLDFKTEDITLGTRAFIHLPRAAIMSNAFLYLEASDYVIQIVDDVRHDKQLIERIENLRKKHYQFAIDDYYGQKERSFEVLEKSISYVKIDCQQTPPDQQRQLVGTYKRMKRKVVIAENIKTQQEYEAAHALGFDYFQGPYFSQPVLVISENIEFNHSSVILLLKELNEEDADFNKIDRIINTDAGLTFRLLARGNTMAFAGKNKFTTASQVVVRMGMEELQKWATLLLMQESAAPGQEEKLEHALLRAIFLESLALKMEPNLSRQDRYFIYIKGMFSIFPVDKREEIFDNMALELAPELVDNANDLLTFNYAYEVGNYELVDMYLIEKGLSELMVLTCYKNAISTVNESLRGK